MNVFAVAQGLVTANDLIESLGVSKSMINYYRNQGFLKYVKIGGRFFYEPITLPEVANIKYKRGRENSKNLA